MSTGNRNVNREGWLWLAPEYFNRWRIFPRAFITFYFWLAFETAMWFMALPVPTPSQAAFASAIISAGAAWFGLYVNSGTMTVGRTTPTPTTYAPTYDPPEPIMKRQPSPNSETDADEVPAYRVKGE